MVCGQKYFYFTGIGSRELYLYKFKTELLLVKDKDYFINSNLIMNYNFSSDKKIIIEKLDSK